MPQSKLSKYKKQSHATYDCRYHLVWSTKYRFKIIDKEIEVALKWIIKEVCDWRDIEILEGSIQPDHIHLYLQIPPKYSISDVAKWIKGKSATRLLQRYERLAKQYWGRSLWARGYFVTTVGITDNIIREYINKQNQQELTEFNSKWN
ncbi:MAG: IS200/IS605 family transposase [Candidatus Kuenenbacteria bacterium]